MLRNFKKLLDNTTSFTHSVEFNALRNRGFVHKRSPDIWLGLMEVTAYEGDNPRDWLC